MKLNSVLLSFYLAPLAWCTPVPIVLVDSLEAVTVSRAAHPPAPVASSRPQHALPQTILLDDDGDDEAEEPVIDNSPVTPSRTAQPSAVLAAHQPVVTSYLLALARLGFGRKFPAFYATQVPDEDAAAIEASSIAQMETGIHIDGADAGPVVSSYYPSVTGGRGDMLAISLVAIFMIFVVVVETCSIVVSR